MVLVKIICCTQTMRDFYLSNKEFVIDTNPNFRCDCNGYGKHTLCFCVCCKCYENLKSGTNLSPVNTYWLKFRSHSENLKSITLNVEMRFMKSREEIDQLPLRWYDRLKRFTRK